MTSDTSKRGTGSRVNREVYDDLVKACRDLGYAPMEIARRTGLNRLTIKRAWNHGWPQRGWAALKDVIAHDHLVKRAVLAESAQERRAAAEEALAEASEIRKVALADAEKIVGDAGERAARRFATLEAEYKERLAELQDVARVDAAETAAAEAQICRGARNTALSMYALAGEMLQRDTLGYLGAQYRRLQEGGQMTPREVVQMTNSLARFGVSIGVLADAALKLERLKLGEPTAIIGVQQIERMTLDEAQAVIDDAADLLRHAREVEAGGKALTDGGGPAGTNGTNGAVH